MNEEEIEVDVRFYLPEAPGDDAASASILNYMQTQYATLYDEDIDLMQGRQSALEDRSRWRAGKKARSETRVGALSELDRTMTHTIETTAGRYCVRVWQDEWIAHSAVCPHQLGPLQDSEIDAEGRITCPWHGFQYRMEDGQSPPPFTEKIATYATRISDGVVFVNPVPNAPGTPQSPSLLGAST